MPSDTYTLTISDAAEAIPADGSVTNAKVAADAAIAYSKLAPLTSGNILVGSASNVATSVNPSGDVDVSDTGVFSIAAGVVVNADINSAAAISISKLAAGTVAGQIIVAGASPTFTPVYTAVSGDATLSGSGVLTIAANAVDSTKLKSDSVTDGNRSVTADHIRDGAVTFQKIEDVVVANSGGTIIGATQTGAVTGIILSELFLKADGTGMLQQTIADEAAAKILPSYTNNTDKVLGLNSSGVLEWVTPAIGTVTVGVDNGGVGFTTYATGDIIYSSTTNQLAKLAIGSANNVLLVSGGVPSWGTLDLTAAGTVGSSILPVANGGTGVNSLASIDTNIGVTAANTISSVNGNISTTGSGNIQTTSTGNIQTTSSGNIQTTSTGNIQATGTGKIGYGTGSGGAVTQITDRTTGVTLDKTNGAITLVSAAGSATFASFTVTNSTVAATDTVIVNQKSGTDRYMIHVTNVSAGTFDITFATTGDTTTEAPVFNFAVIKAVAS
jgi:hypothetical protein